MYKVLKTLILIIWIIDILNIDFNIANIHIAEYLDVTIPVNFWFWTFFWLLAPATNNIKISKKGED